ncbi:hypothetical protein, partial [Escherichia coli]
IGIMPTSEISYLVADGRLTNLDARMRKTSETFFLCNRPIIRVFFVCRKVGDFWRIQQWRGFCDFL